MELHCPARLGCVAPCLLLSLVCVSQHSRWYVQQLQHELQAAAHASKAELAALQREHAGALEMAVAAVRAERDALDAERAEMPMAAEADESLAMAALTQQCDRPLDTDASLSSQSQGLAYVAQPGHRELATSS